MTIEDPKDEDGRNKGGEQMKKSTQQEIWMWVKTILWAVAIVLLLERFVFVPTVVQGVSMMPTLQDGNRLIVSKLGEIKRFDEIVFRAPDAPKNYVKRVIGLPGDTIVLKEDQLYINGMLTPEPYLDNSKKKLAVGDYLNDDFTLEMLTGELRVPKGHLFVMGDNRPRSHDSREFGFIKTSSVIGQVEVRIWPLNKIGSTK